MRAKETPPTAGNHLIWVDRKKGLYKWFRTEVVELGRAKFLDVRTWEDDEGVKHGSPHEILVKYLDRRRESGAPLDLGRYHVEGTVKAVHKRTSEVVIETSKGDIVIRLDGGK